MSKRAKSPAPLPRVDPERELDELAPQPTDQTANRRRAIAGFVSFLVLILIAVAMYRLVSPG